MKYKMLILCCALLFFAVVSQAQATVIDAPHNDTMNVNCRDCHTYSLWWTYSPLPNGDASKYSPLVESLCDRCHGTNGSSVLAHTHSSDTFGTRAKYAPWVTSCLDCHDPHFQGQLDWVDEENTSYPAGLYLFTGTVSGTPAYDSLANQTTFTYTIAATDDINLNWADPASWSNKNFAGSGAILVEDKIFNLNTFVIRSASGTLIDASGGNGSMTVSGNFAGATGSSFGILYGQLIKQKILASDSGVEEDVKLFDGRATYDSGAVGGFVDSAGPVRQGICQICHSLTTYYTSDGNSEAPLTGHYTYRLCTDCHLHQDGFMPTPDHSSNDLSYVTDTPLCINCHQHAANEPMLVHNENCYTCHVAPIPALANALDKPAATAIPAGGGSCDTCHGAYFVGHTHDHTNSIIANSDVSTATVDCVSCHNETDRITGTHDRLNAGLDSLCIKCHALGVNDNGSLIGSAQGHLDGGECVTCHGNYFDGHDHGIDGGSFAHITAINEETILNGGDRSHVHEALCSDCHRDLDFANISTVDYVPVFLSNWESILWEHDLDGLKDGIGACVTCHDATRLVDVNSSTGLTVQDIIHSSGAVQCLSCHVAKQSPAAHGGTHTEGDGTFDWTGDALCESCHGALSTNPNAQKGEIIAGVHSSQCQLCHIDGAAGAPPPVNSSAEAVWDSVNSKWNGNVPHSCTDCHSTGFDGHGHNHLNSVRTPSDISTFTKNCLTSGCHVASSNPFVSNGEVHGVDGCASCHDVTANGALTGSAFGKLNGGECITCHTGAFLGHNQHTSTAHEVALGVGDVSQGNASGCSATGCHDQFSLGSWDGIYQEHKSDCLMCHDSNRDTSKRGDASIGKSILDIIQIDGVTVNCVDCHRDKVDGVSTDPTHGGHTVGAFAWDTTTQATCGTADCHDASVNSDVVVDVHEGVCTLCHSTAGGGRNTAKIGDNGLGDANSGAVPDLTAVNCLVCHGTNYMETITTTMWDQPSTSTVTTYGGVHHKNAHATVGNCNWCHIDPRPIWEMPAPDGYGLSGPTTLPMQLACKSCHVNPTSNGFVVYENDFSDMQRTDGSTPYDNGQNYTSSTSIWNDITKQVLNGKEPYVHQRIVHELPGNAAIEVRNYGICLGCHDGVKASAVNIWHAKQTMAEIPTDSDNNAYNFNFDVLRKSPGREKFGGLWIGNDPGKGKTNSYPYYSHGAEWYKNGGNEEERAKNIFKDSYEKRDKWSDPDDDPYYGPATVAHSLITVPCFSNAGVGNDQEGLCASHGSSLPVLPNIANDDLAISRAEWDGVNLTVWAVNAYVDNAVLTFDYNGLTSNSMTYKPLKGRWEATVASPYAASVTVNSSGTATDTAVVLDVSIP